MYFEPRQAKLAIGNCEGMKSGVSNLAPQVGTYNPPVNTATYASACCRRPGRSFLISPARLLEGLLERYYLVHEDNCPPLPRIKHWQCRYPFS
jgi:hypothetical protein